MASAQPRNNSSPTTLGHSSSAPDVTLPPSNQSDHSRSLPVQRLPSAPALPLGQALPKIPRGQFVKQDQSSSPAQHPSSDDYEVPPIRKVDQQFQHVAPTKTDPASRAHLEGVYDTKTTMSNVGGRQILLKTASGTTIGEVVQVGKRQGFQGNDNPAAQAAGVIHPSKQRSSIPQGGELNGNSNSSNPSRNGAQHSDANSRSNISSGNPTNNAQKGEHEPDPSTNRGAHSQDNRHFQGSQVYRSDDAVVEESDGDHGPEGDVYWAEGDMEGGPDGQSQLHQPDGHMQVDRDEYAEDQQFIFDPQAPIDEFNYNALLVAPWDNAQREIGPLLKNFAESVIGTAFETVITVAKLYHHLNETTKENLEQGVADIRAEEDKHDQARQVITEFSNELKSVAERLKAFENRAAEMGMGGDSRQGKTRG